MCPTGNGISSAHPGWGTIPIDRSLWANHIDEVNDLSMISLRQVVLGDETGSYCAGIVALVDSEQNGLNVVADVNGQE